MKAKPLFSTIAFSVVVRVANKQKAIKAITINKATVCKVVTFEADGYGDVQIKFEATVKQANEISKSINIMEGEVANGDQDSFAKYSITD